MQIFTCDSCHYCFPADEQPDRCVDCGKIAVRLATPEEIKEYWRIRAEIEAEERGQLFENR